jgi:hypothetical protein
MPIPDAIEPAIGSARSCEALSHYIFHYTVDFAEVRSSLAAVVWLEATHSTRLVANRSENSIHSQCKSFAVAKARGGSCNRDGISPRFGSSSLAASSSSAAPASTSLE